MPRWDIFAGDREYDREVTQGQCFGQVEADSKQEAERKGAHLLGFHITAGAWAVPVKDQDKA